MANNGDIMKRIFSYLLCVSLILPSLTQAHPGSSDDEFDEGSNFLRSILKHKGALDYSSSSIDLRYGLESETDAINIQPLKTQAPEVLDWGKLSPSLQHLPPKILLNFFSKLDEPSKTHLMQVSKKMQDLVLLLDLKVMVSSGKQQGIQELLLSTCRSSQKLENQIYFLFRNLENPNAFRFYRHPHLRGIYDSARDLSILFKFGIVDLEETNEIYKTLGITAFSTDVIEAAKSKNVPLTVLDKTWLNTRYFGFFQRLPESVLNGVLLPMLDDKTLGHLMQTCRFFLEPCQFSLFKDKALLVLDQGLWPLVRDRGFFPDKPHEPQLENIKRILSAPHETKTHNLRFSALYQDVLDIYVLLQSGKNKAEVTENFPELGTIYMDTKWISDLPPFAAKRVEKFKQSLVRVDDDAIGLALRYLNDRDLGRFMQTSKRMKQIAMVVAFERRMKLLAPHLEGIGEAIKFQWDHDIPEGKFQALTRLTDFYVPWINKYDPSYIVEHLNLEELYLTHYLHDPKKHTNPFDEDTPPAYTETPAIKRKRLIVRYAHGLVGEFPLLGALLPQKKTQKKIRGWISFPPDYSRKICQAALFLSEDQIREFAMNISKLYADQNIPQYFLIKAASRKRIPFFNSFIGSDALRLLRNSKSFQENKLKEEGSKNKSSDRNDKCMIQ